MLFFDKENKNALDNTETYFSTQDKANFLFGFHKFKVRHTKLEKKTTSFFPRFVNKLFESLFLFINKITLFNNKEAR